MNEEDNIPSPDDQQVINDAQRVYNLLVELYQEKRRKKEATRMHNQEIRRIQDEIDEILSHHNEENNNQEEE